VRIRWLSGKIIFAQKSFRQRRHSGTASFFWVTWPRTGTSNRIYRLITESKDNREFVTVHYNSVLHKEKNIELFGDDKIATIVFCVFCQITTGTFRTVPGTVLGSLFFD
jgi:hypothetical protein